jgi:hypothetical protein
LHALGAEQLESGSSVCLGTGAQVPTEPGIAHDWHVPQEALPQQTPSTQLPDVQSLGDPHVLPSCLPHRPVESQVESPPQVSS